MLTNTQIDHFQTFGLVALRAFPAENILRLRDEVDAAIRDAYAATYEERVFDGISGHYLSAVSLPIPAMSRLAGPETSSHPRRIQIAERTRAAGVLDLEGAEVGW